MNFDEIRNMNDMQLKKYLNNLTNRHVYYCAKCDSVVSNRERRNISVGICNKCVGQVSRKLCTLCDNCYVELLDFLGVNEPNWEE